MCVVSDDAFAAGAASIPGPFSDASSDLWLVHRYLYSSTVFGTGVGISHPTEGVEIDSKAMRKMHDEVTLAFMVENGHPTAGADFWFGLRMLFSNTGR
jgi:hypothetical protein